MIQLCQYSLVIIGCDSERKKMFKKRALFIDEKEVYPGEIFAIEVEKGREYFSPKAENGKADIVFSTDELDDTLNWIYLGTTIRKGKKCLAVLLENPQFEVPLNGALGYINAPKVLGNVCNLLKAEGMVDIKIPTIIDMLEILFGQWYSPKLKPKIFTYDGSSYSPESFLEGEFESNGKMITTQIQSAYLVEEEDLLPLLNKMYWLLPCDRLATSNDRLNFCVGACFNKVILPYYTLFSSNGYENEGCFGIRPIAYIEYRSLDKWEEEYKSYTKFAQYIMTECGMGINMPLHITYS